MQNNKVVKIELQLSRGLIILSSGFSQYRVPAFATVVFIDGTVLYVIMEVQLIEGIGSITLKMKCV